MHCLGGAWAQSSGLGSGFGVWGMEYKAEHGFKPAGLGTCTSKTPNLHPQVFGEQVTQTHGFKSGDFQVTQVFTMVHNVAPTSSTKIVNYIS